MIYIQRARGYCKAYVQIHLKKGKNKQKKTLLWNFRKGRALVSVEEFSSHTAVLAVYTCNDHVNTASSSISSSSHLCFLCLQLSASISNISVLLAFLSQVCGHFGFLYVPLCIQSTLITFSSVTSSFSIFPVNFNRWAWGEFIAVCFFLTLLLLPCFKTLGQISLLPTLRNRLKGGSS